MLKNVKKTVSTTSRRPFCAKFNVCFRRHFRHVQNLVYVFASSRRRHDRHVQNLVYVFPNVTTVTSSVNFS